MPSASYTQRFVWLECEGQGVLQRVYEVPEGYRAVIKCVAGGIGGVADSGFAVVAHGLQLMTFRPPAADSTMFANFTLPIYERETISLVAWGSYAAVAVSGYIFTDTSGPIGAPGPPVLRIADPDTKPTPEQLGDLAA